jgi:hypothetical protein
VCAPTKLLFTVNLIAQSQDIVMQDEGELVQAHVAHEYGISLSATRAATLAAQVEQILSMAREHVSRLSFDDEPGDFPAALLRERDRG